MTRNAYNPEASGQTNEFPEYEAKFGEDPARFLESNELMATARIAGIRDADLLAAYRTVAEQITAGNYRETILDAIADRESELTGSVSEPTPDAETTEPVPATDGGTELTFDEDEPDEPDDVHPEADALEPGAVLVVDRGAKTEYVFPTTEAADAPYLSRAHEDDTGDLWMELKIDADDLRERQSKGGERTTLEAIDVDIPRSAATGGDA